MSGFTFLAPVGFLGLSALVAVGAIYLFYQRFRDVRITALFLWDEPVRSTDAGRRLRPPSVTRSLVLDLLAAMFAALALALPALRAPDTTPIAIILDDSLSMRGNNAWKAARDDAILRADEHTGPVTVFRAGSVPRCTATLDGGPATVRKAIAEWEPFSPADSVRASVELAGAVLPEGGTIHVYTDREHPRPQTSNTRTIVHLVPTYGPNVAFTLVERASLPGTVLDRIHAGIANYSTDPIAVQIHMRDENGIAGTVERTLAPGASDMISADIPATTGAVHLTLYTIGDSLTDDSTAVLLPQPGGFLTARVQVADAELARLLMRGLSASGTHPDEAPDFLITDDAHACGKSLTVRVRAGTVATPFIGPYVVDGALPLCQDVHLEGIVWSADENVRAPSPEAGIITCGETALLYHLDADTLGLNLRAEGSSVGRTAAWPVLMTNLVRRAAERRAGLHNAACTPGSSLHWMPYAEALRNPDTIRPEGESARAIPFTGRAPEEPGSYELCHAGNMIARLRVNAIAPAESNLSGAAKREAIIESEGSGTRPPAQSTKHLAWAFVLAALGLLGINWALDVRRDRLGQE